MKRLEKKRTAMIDEINQVIDEQKRKQIVVKEKESRNMRDDRSQFRTKIDYLDKMTTSLDSNIGAYTDFDVIEMEIKMLKALTELEAYNGDRSITEVKYVPGEINRAAIAEMIDRIEETTATFDAGVNIEEVKTFNEFDEIIRTIAPMPGDQALVGDDEINTIKQLSLQSTKTKTVTLPPHSDFITLSNGDFIVTHYKDQEIRRFMSAGKVSDIVSTKPLSPSCISKTQTGDILATLMDDGDDYKLRPSSRRLVQRITLTGNVLHTYEFREDGVTRLFTLPHRTAENGNSEICVINRTSGDTGELVVLHGDGRVKATYRGEEAFRFDPMDVVCDSKNIIIVSDWNNKCLHLLSPDGKFLRYLLSDIFESPYVIAFYQASLWIGFREGTVKVYKFKYSH